MLRVIAFGAGLPFLVACADLPGLTSGNGGPSLPLYNGAVMAQGPEGFCADSRLSRPARGFAALVSCALVSDLAIVPSIDGLITIQAGDAGTAGVTGSEATIAEGLRTASGAAILSRSGTAAEIDLDTVETSPGLVIVHFTDTGAPIAEGVEQPEWRAFLDLGDRLVTIGVRGFERDPLGRRAGLRLLNRAVASLRAANPATPDG